MHIINTNIKTNTIIYLITTEKKNLVHFLMIINNYYHVSVIIPKTKTDNFILFSETKIKLFSIHNCFLEIIFKW